LTCGGTGCRERLLLLAEVPPQVEQREEVGVLVGEPGVQLVGGLLVLAGPLAGSWMVSPGRDDQHLLQHAAPVGLDDHPRHARVQRQGGQRAAGAVSAPSPSSAPSSSSSARPSATARRSGGSMNGKSATSPSSSAAICSSTEARLVRRISGSVYSGGVEVASV
jgi:hypothetical protein